MAPNKNNDTANLILAIALSLLIYCGWEYFIEMPRKQAEISAQRQQSLQQQKEGNNALRIANEPIVSKTHDELLAESERVHIDSPSLNGSIALKGLRFDDLTLKNYRATLAPNSPAVTLLSPAGNELSYYAHFGWLSDDANIKLPDDNTVWSADSKTLSPAAPLTLTWKNNTGIAFKMVIALDDKYMFTITQSAEDASGKPVALRNYAYINHVDNSVTQQKKPIAGGPLTSMYDGALGVFNGTLSEVTYKKLKEEKEQEFDSESGWLGVSTEKYWLTAIVPADEAFHTTFSYYEKNGIDHFQADYLSQPQTQTTLHFFAGAKELTVLDGYAAQYHITLFDRAIDFGWLYFLTKPIFKALSYFYSLVGNFGVAILVLTVIVKLLMFPLANKSFKSMNQMKVLTPKMNEIRARHKDDKLKLNQEIMELYKREKINPAGGCLPMFIQLPIFLALYKVLYVTIEMRQAPFFGWIHDLSAPDPTNLFTLFGLLQWEPPTILHLGLWPILYGITFFITQLQSPPPPDPVQAKMMKALPFVFMFFFANMPAGLVIYWCWSNLLTILQQWYIKTTHAATPAPETKKKR